MCNHYNKSDLIFSSHDESQNENFKQKTEVSAKREFKLTEFQINTIELSIKEEKEKKRQF